MGRSYWFECSRCGYRVVVSGKPDRGPDFFVETIACLECKKLYDAVTKLRISAPPPLRDSAGLLLRKREPQTPAPTFEAALSRLLVVGVKRHRWKTFKPACPVSPKHRIQQWKDPGVCPKCGLAMDKNPLPYRIWE